MKKISTLFILLCTATIMRAQTPGISNLNVSSDEETVAVSFTVAVGRKATPAGMTVVYAPVITDGQHKVSLPPIIVRGNRASVAWERHEWAAGNRAAHGDGIYTHNGGTVGYVASVPFQPWMHDSRIEMETVAAGCCNSDTSLSVLAAGILPSPAPEPEPEPTPEPGPTVIEFLQSAFSFVLPASDFDPDEPIKFYDDERDNALTVYYNINRYDIEKGYADNEQTLTNLLAAIETIQSSGEGDVERVVVAGFASPEGRLEANDRLAWERAVSVKEYIMKNSALPDENIMLFNGSADWRGLRLLVAADPDVPGQREVLEIIDRQPQANAATHLTRQTLLRALNDGRTYRYLAENIFPKLRNGAFIRVYFEIK